MKEKADFEVVTKKQQQKNKSCKVEKNVYNKGLERKKGKNENHASLFERILNSR